MNHRVFVNGNDLGSFSADSIPELQQRVATLLGVDHDRLTHIDTEYRDATGGPAPAAITAPCHPCVGSR
jgi:hypothetical protein